LQASAMTAHCSSAVMWPGAPLRGASLKRSRAGPVPASQRPRQWLTVLRQAPKRAAVSVMFRPATKCKIIRARKAVLCAVERARTKASKSDLSAAVKTRTVAEIPMLFSKTNHAP
jgi:hypothetical protein